MNNFFIYGSKSSIDYDVLVFVDEIDKIIDNNHNYIKELKIILKNKFNELGWEEKIINPNLAVLRDGIILEVFKGTSDELNNSVYYTYKNHKQIFENPILRTVKRDIDLKNLRTCRAILSFFSRTDLRYRIKEALGSDLLSKIQILKEIDFTKIEIVDKKDNIIDIWKTVAFQLGQCLALNYGIEVYSKEEIIVLPNFSDLEPFLMRKKGDLDVLNNIKKKLISNIEIRIPYMKTLFEYKI